MRKRFLATVSLFGLLLSLLFGAAVLLAFYMIEDFAYARQLNELIRQDSANALVSNYSGLESELPADLRSLVADLPPGRHEIEQPDHEIHLLIKSNGSEAERDVALIRVPESADLERLVLGSLAVAIIVTTLIGLVLGRFLVARTVRPIEALVGWLKRARATRQSPPESDSEELRLLATALDAYILQQDTKIERERAFVREASHELRTPISIIRGVCEIAEQAPLTEDAIARIRRSSTRMEHTVEGLLCLARKEQQLQGVDFQKEWDSLIAEIQERYGKRIPLTLKVEWTPREALAGRMIILAAATLLGNAFEHAEASMISASLTESGLTVVDDGKGIVALAEIQSALKNLHPLPEGGLGLSLVERICRRMSWEFRLEERQPGTSATLMIR